MRQIAILALVLAVLVPGSLPAQARGQQEKQEIGPILRERGQPAPAQPAEDPGPPDYTQSADFTRNRLQQLLYQLPPNVRSILQYDPSLADKPDYLTPYPTLQAFLKQHPEISRNPEYFFGQPPSQRGPDPTEFLAGDPGRNRALHLFHDPAHHSGFRCEAGRGVPPLGSTNAKCRSTSTRRSSIACSQTRSCWHTCRRRLEKPSSSLRRPGQARRHAGIDCAIRSYPLVGPGRCRPCLAWHRPALCPGSRPGGNRSSVYRARRHRDVARFRCCDVCRRCLRALVPVRLVAKPETRNQCVM